MMGSGAWADINNPPRGGSQPIGMCGFSLMPFRSCLNIHLGACIYLFVYLFPSLFLYPQQTVQMLYPPPLKLGEQITWPLGGFQVRDLFLYWPGSEWRWRGVGPGDPICSDLIG